MPPFQAWSVSARSRNPSNFIGQSSCSKIIEQFFLFWNYVQSISWCSFDNLFKLLKISENIISTWCIYTEAQYCKRVTLQHLLWRKTLQHLSVDCYLRNVKNIIEEQPGTPAVSPRGFDRSNRRSILFNRPSAALKDCLRQPLLRFSDLYVRVVTHNTRWKVHK